MTTDKHPPIPQRQHHPATPSSAGSTTPGGGIEPPRRQPAPSKFSLPTPPQTDRETRRRAETPKIPVPVIDQTQSPRPRRRAQTEQTKTGDRTPDLTRPTNPTRHTSTDRKRTYLAVGRLGGPLELAGASQFGPCVGLEGGRDGSRPSRPPHGHAGCSRRGRTRLRGRERPPAQLQGVARSCNLRDIGGFASILSCFVTSQKLN